MINVVVNGCNGAMGQVVIKVAQKDPKVTVVAGVDKYPDIKNNRIPVFSNFDECNVIPDVIIDFSRPEALYDIIQYAKDKKIPLVIATTGFSKDNYELLKNASREIPVFISSNMALGVNVMMDLVRKATSVLGEGFDIEIIEKHHNKKIDAPSGTALSLAKAINDVLRNSKNFTYGRNPKSDKRSTAEIGIHAVRGGTIVGEHTVLYAGHDEVLEIKHTALSREIFAAGAIKAAKFIVDKGPGLYNMEDIVLEKSLVTNVYTSNTDAMITLNNIPQQPKIIAEIFSNIAERKINIDMISQTAPVDGLVDISFSMPEHQLNQAIECIGTFKNRLPKLRLDIFTEVTKLTVEGQGMERQSGVAAKMFNILAEQDIQIKIITTSETKISYIIDQIDEKAAVEAIIQAFEL